MIVKTTAIALRISPFSKTSQVISWLSEDQGRIATLAKGFQRPKSISLGECDLFYTCEVLYYPRQEGRLNILKECTALNTHPALRSHLSACACASYFCDLIWRLCPPDAPHPELFKLLSEALSALALPPVPVGLIYWFELQVLASMGVAPRLGECPLCGNPILLQSGKTAFSAAHGGSICADCAKGNRGPSHPLTPDVRAILHDWQLSLSPQKAVRTICSGRQDQAIRQVLGNFLEYHLDFLPASRTITLALLDRPESA